MPEDSYFDTSTGKKQKKPTTVGQIANSTALLPTLGIGAGIGAGLGGLAGAFAGDSLAKAAPTGAVVGGAVGLSAGGVLAYLLHRKLAERRNKAVNADELPVTDKLGLTNPFVNYQTLDPNGSYGSAAAWGALRGIAPGLAAEIASAA